MCVYMYKYIYIYVSLYRLFRLYLIGFPDSNVFVVFFPPEASGCDNGRAVHARGDRPPNVRPERTDMFLQWGIS